MTRAPIRGEILCFGEALWDELPGSRRLGGAPLNVAYHLRAQGWPAVVVSAVGDDALGAELLSALGDLGLPTGDVGVVAGEVTAVVEVAIDAAGQPTFTIPRRCAWDAIPVGPRLLERASRAAAIVYGTVAQRGRANREAIERLCASGAGLRVYDVNLRPGNDDAGLVRELAAWADLIKVSDEEARALVGTGVPADAARRVAASFGARRVCVTAGARGAGLWEEGHARWTWCAARPVAVVDTVGAGDAFVAGLLAGLLAARPVSDSLAAAARLAEVVVGSVGAFGGAGGRGRSNSRRRHAT